ncbi:hypothetical protein T492DRAFT_1104200 [Pavlovales sp. CCMP2436]|nr:hypothetical protein T492DRAFT_1104200 [Pavlovales sp. CCMP2436]
MMTRPGPTPPRPAATTRRSPGGSSRGPSGSPVVCARWWRRRPTARRPTSAASAPVTPIACATASACARSRATSRSCSRTRSPVWARRGSGTCPKTACATAAPSRMGGCAPGTSTARCWCARGGPARQSATRSSRRRGRTGSRSFVRCRSSSRRTVVTPSPPPRWRRSAQACRLSSDRRAEVAGGRPRGCTPWSPR